jgi:putative oxidoreductase
MRLKFLSRFREEGLLLLRLGLGAMFIYHGWPLILGGPERWQELGRALASLGVTALPALWGLLAALCEFGGGLCLLLGLFFRPACLALSTTMAVAVHWHFVRGEGLAGASHALEVGVVFLALALIGPGRYGLDRG